MRPLVTVSPSHMPKDVRRSLAVLLLLAPLHAYAQSSDARRAAGDWVFHMDGDATPQRVQLAADGDTLRGRVYGQTLVGTISASRLLIRVGEFRWRGKVTGDSITGWLGIGSDSSRWSAHRFRPPAVSRTYTLTPATYERTLRSTGAPALTIYPGDTVRTSTVDAGGWGRGAFGDRTNKLTRGGNPLTGPIYVEGALPGDVLVVKLVRVRLNRDWAFSGTALMDNAIEPGYAAERKFGQDDNKWLLDTIAGVARLKSPSQALRDLTIPLAPFLGVVAVAPGDGITPSSRDSGPFGGNMEYAQMREGTTLYLPVTEEGAWLHVGDGHAAQGDGELTGDAMETSMDVVFTVGIQRYRFNDITRAESATDVMSIGVAGSLDQAMRRATSDMARWLERDYKLTATEAAIVMGFTVRYDIPDIVPPWVSVVARLPKSALASLRAKE